MKLAQKRFKIHTLYPNWICYTRVLCRIRQIRVRNDSCQVHPDFQNAIKHCYDEYSESNEDREPFGSGFRHRTSAKAWSYNEADVTMGNTHGGIIATYGPAGSIQVSRIHNS